MCTHNACYMNRRERRTTLKTRLLATIFVILLFSGTFAAIFPIAIGDTEVRYLTISYLPGTMPTPATLPAVGTHNLTLGSEIAIEAPEYVADTSDTQWRFDEWAVYNEEADTWYNTTNRNHTVILNANKTAYACYVRQFLFTVITAYDVPNIWGGSWHENTSSMFFDEGHTVYAGVMKNNPNDWISLGPGCRAYFINWTGDATGKIDNVFWHSDPIVLDAPKTAIAEWVVKYKLWTDSDSEYYPWGPGSGWYDPDKRGWYANCTDVDLTAPSVDNENPGNWRWRFDYWLVERWNGTHWVPSFYFTENITVHLGPYTKATVYFALQYYLTVADTIGGLTGVSSYSGYYDYCSNITIVAPDPVPDPVIAGKRYAFYKWFLSAVFDHFNPSVTVHIEHVTTVGKTLWAIYNTEYYLDAGDNIGGLSGVSSYSGWYLSGTVVPMTAPDYVPVDADTRYKFDEWEKDPGNYIDTNPATTITMNGPRNATAFYTRQFRATWTADPAFLNTNIAGFPGEMWLDENVKYWWYAPSGPIGPFFPFNYTFDHWEINSGPYPQYQNWIHVNTTGPLTGVAYYRGVSAFFITPQMVVVDAPAACTTFTVNVTAANIEDLYAFDFNVTWDPTLIELVDVDYEVNEIWGTYFEAIQEVNNTAGYFWYVATSLDGAPDAPYGFTGTNKIVALTFHIIYDPCYIDDDYFRECNLTLNVKKLANSTGHEMYPENVHGGYYRINAIQPTIYMKPSAVVASDKDFIFQVEIWINQSVKLHDWYALIYFNTDHLDIIEVVIDESFLIGPYEYFLVHKSDEGGYIEIHIVQQQPGETLAYGEGRLATLTFQVNQWIIWNTSNPDLHSWIFFELVAISVKCPELECIYPPLLLYEDCQYTYLPIPGDVNGDGVVNILDLILVAGEYGDCSTYDLNEDGFVELLDLVIVAINYGRTEP
jgi:hypothetical protein